MANGPNIPFRDRGGAAAYIAKRLRGVSRRIEGAAYRATERVKAGARGVGARFSALPPTTQRRLAIGSLAAGSVYAGYRIAQSRDAGPPGKTAAGGGGAG